MSIRRLGEGYEPHVDEQEGALSYSLPVDSGFVSVDFCFDIQQRDLDVLLSDPRRRAMLEIVAHTLLQQSMVPNSARVVQAEFDGVVWSVLHSTPLELECYIDRIDADHHLVTRLYVEQILARRSAASSA